MAGAFSIPYVLQGGAPFPQRNLIIFISAGVILFSLLETSIILPILVKKEEQSKGEDKNKIERKAFIKVIEASVKVLKEEINDENKKAALDIIASYNRYIRKSYRSENQVELNLQSSEMKKDIYAKALKVEEDEIEQLFKAGKISQNVYNVLKEKFNHTESILSNGLKHRIILAISIIKGAASKMLSSSNNDSMTDVKEIESAKILAYNAAISAIRKEINDENRGISLEIVAHYTEFIRRIQRDS